MLMSFFMYISLNIYIYGYSLLYTPRVHRVFVGPHTFGPGFWEDPQKGSHSPQWNTGHGEDLSWKADLTSFFDTLPDTNSKFGPENTLKLL